MFSNIKSVIATLKENKENKADQKKKEKDIQNIKAQIDDAYEEWCDEYDEEADFVCTAIPTSEPLQGKLLLNPVKKLLNKDPSCWNNDDLMPIAELLAGRPFIDGSGDNFEGASAFHSIMPDFDLYLEEHDDIRGIVDPIYCDCTSSSRT
ncbi:3977_t:CDS:2 [Paraglomus brasilianum]|uniref:3977_t:CDS:1 n=1 Tax=Paraglomus brasilianum TaxID=144538 RepID=A0A9N8VPE2_9GLOM|nr:3977_t:CDS:2 [Paraglomus brasilianum]